MAGRAGTREPQTHEHEDQEQDENDEWKPFPQPCEAHLREQITWGLNSGSQCVAPSELDRGGWDYECTLTADGLKGSPAENTYGYEINSEKVTGFSG